MLRSINELRGYTILATNGEIGRVDDFYFDDKDWTIRYLVVNTGSWLAERRVLLTPQVLERPNWETQQLPVLVNKEQVRNSPDFELDRPISRPYELALYEYYGWPSYWAAPVAAGPFYVPPVMPPPLEQPQEHIEGDPHLRSAVEVTGYYIHARDGEIGHVEDFLVDDEGWKLHYMVVDTGNWLPGKKVLVAPTWIETINWLDSQVVVDLQRDTIRNSPEYDPSRPVERAYEERLYTHYGRPKYWLM